MIVKHHLLLIFLLTGCGAGASGTNADLGTYPTADATPARDGAPSAIPYPVPDWATTTPAGAHLDPARLEKARAYSESVGGLCLLVIRHGRIAYEAYYNGASQTDQQKSWSMAKSFTSAAVGIALTRGEIKSVDDSAASYIPAWKGTNREPIKLRHLLDMVSGLQFDTLGDSLWTLFTKDMTAEALAKKVADPPNTRYNYSNHDTQVFQAILKNATGMEPDDYLRKYLWGPLGFQPTTLWGKDPTGHTTMFMGIEASCRDYARFGYFWLHKGNWNGLSIVRPEYVAETLAPSSAVNAGHSHYWWLNGYTPYINSQNSQGSTSVPMFPDAPADLFSAQGLGQNFIDVIPSTDTIYVHTRPAPKMDGSQIGPLLNDGKMVEHREVLRLLLAADLPP